MFESAELGHTLDKETFDAKEEVLRTRLLEAQADLEAAKIPVLVVIAGVDGAGKGETVNLLHEWMDPRYLETYAFGEPSDDEAERPPYWRFWRSLPARGRVGILFGSWYTEPIVDRAYGRIDDDELESAMVRVNAFERELVDDGALIIKLWFHLSKKAQRKRLRALEGDPDTSWRVTKDDWKAFEHYDDFRQVAEHALRATSVGDRPWFVVEGADERYRSVTVAEHILARIDIRLAEEAARVSRAAKPAAKAGAKGGAKAGRVRRRGASTGAPRTAAATEDPYTLLDTLDLSKSLEDDEYKKRLAKYQGRLNRLYRKAKAEGRSTILVFEGWDAAGKGGAIRRLTSAMDARDYQVIPIAAPTDEERAHHYLWRFWRRLPRAGRVTIYDRSWYGRVLVERVEGFATPAEWGRAYGEIVDFERQLADHGAVICKFWLHIDPDEQLRRFKEREKTPYKHFKITEEDFRNRSKWPEYELAANEMLDRTGTDFAPWTLVEANDKQFARVKVLKTVCDALKAQL